MEIYGLCEEVKKITEMFTPEEIEMAKDFGEQQAFEEIPRTISFFNEGQDCVTPFRDETLREEFTLAEAVEYYGFKKVYDFIDNVQCFFLSEEENTGNTMNLTTEAIIKEFKLALLDDGRYIEIDNGEFDNWNYLLETDVDEVRVVVYKASLEDEMYTTVSNAFKLGRQEFIRKPWRELEKMINAACSYAY